MLHVLGSINLDMIATGQRLPIAGETVFGRDFITAPGGKGANQALAAARAGGNVRMFGAIGNDRFGPLALENLAKAGVGLGGVKRPKENTGIALIMVDGRSENMIMVVPGANSLVDERTALECIDLMTGSDHLVMVQEIPPSAIRAALRAARTRNITSILNIAPAIAQTRELAVLADIVIANQSEILHLLDMEIREHAWADVERGAARWAGSNERVLVVTRGKGGAVAFCKNERIEIAAPKVEAVDTVGAGDSFCGYLAAGLDGGMDLETAIRHGVVAGALACTKPSAQGAIPHMNEVKKAMAT